MSQNVVPGWVYTSYKEGVIPKLQTRGYLMAGTVMQGDINGNEVQWFTGGRMETEEIDRSFGDAEIQHPARGNIKRNFKDYAAAAAVSIVDINKIKPNEMETLKVEGAAAIGRRSDWIILDELSRAAVAAEVATVGDGTANIDVLPILLARDDIAGIGDTSVNSIYCAIPEYAFSTLALIKEFANADWVGGDLPLMKLTSERKTWRNINFFTFPDEYFTRQGNVKGSGDFFGYIWWKGAIGFERNDPKLDVAISYLPLKRHWFFDNVIGGAAAVLQPDAVKRLWFNWAVPARPA